MWFVFTLMKYLSWRLYLVVEIVLLRKEISYFGLARNLIQRIISPNQDDLS